LGEIRETDETIDNSEIEIDKKKGKGRECMYQNMKRMNDNNWGV
jgi:hypothetical protein